MRFSEFSTRPWGEGLGVRDVFAWNTEATAMVSWNYNWQMTKTLSWTTCRILAVPTITTNDTEITDLPQIVANNSFVYDWFNNLPNSYKKSKFKFDWWFSFTPNNIISYTDTWSCNALTDKTNYTARISLLKWLQESYSGTTLKNEWEIKNVLALNINTNNPSQTVKNYAGNYANNYLGANINIDTTIVCNNWYVLQNGSCVADFCNWSLPANTVSNATSQNSSTSWMRNTTPWICTYDCNSSYTWTGSSCNINIPTVSKIIITNMVTTYSYYVFDKLEFYNEDNVKFNIWSNISDWLNTYTTSNMTVNTPATYYWTANGQHMYKPIKIFDNTNEYWIGMTALNWPFTITFNTPFKISKFNLIPYPDNPYYNWNMNSATFTFYDADNQVVNTYNYTASSTTHNILDTITLY